MGSIDGDNPAAMRYTEARLGRIAEEMLADINKDTVDFQFNFDDSLEEPSVLPARIPNLLINGASGIAVGMATNMLPHNIAEVIDGTIAVVDQPTITIPEIMKYIKGPDFPTGGTIYGSSGITEAFMTGRGRVVVRGRAEIQTLPSGKEIIVITEIPYQVNKASLHAKIVELAHEQKITGISEVRDESSREEIRLVVELKRDAISQVVLSQLFNFTPLQSSFGVNNVALLDGRPRTLNLKELIEAFIKFRLDVIVRRTRFDLARAEERAHVLQGLLIALDNLDEVINLIRSSKTVDEAQSGLIERFSLSEIQSKAILEMRLQRLTGLERDKVRAEYEETMRLITEYKAILESEQLQRDIIKKELTEIREKFGDARRTEIVAAEGEISYEDLIANDAEVVTISHLGYIKRTKADEYKLQGRGGKGSRGSKTREEDFIEHMFVAKTHNHLLLFTEKGRCHWLRVYEIPEASKTSFGRAIQNILSLPPDDAVKAYIIVEDLQDAQFLNSHFIVFATKMGMVKKTLVEAFSRPRTNGINAISIREGDQLIDARLTDGNHEVFLASTDGFAVRFNESTVRDMGRTAAGVRGMTLRQGAHVVGLVCVPADDKEHTILVISEKGTGKRSEIEEYRLTNRGGKGVKTIRITGKTGKLLAIKAVIEDDDLMITSKAGIMIRMAIREISIMGRDTQGVRVITLNEEDEIADIAVVHKDEEDDDVERMKPGTDPMDEEE
jgi:DNA gyrase subunit A